jgi:hypothetical protein
VSDLSKFIAAQAEHYIDNVASFIGHMAFDHPNEFLTAVSTIVVAIFTCVLARSTKRLWITTRDSAQAQSADMRVSIAAAEDAARAANRTAQALIDAERPWIGLVTTHKVQVGPNIEPRAEVVIKNTGRTPARNLRVAFVGAIRTAAEGIPEIPNTEGAPARVLIPENPDFHRPFEGAGNMTRETFQEIITGRTIAWIVGRMDYLDGAGAPHWTTMRLFYRHEGNEFHAHQDGNDVT